MVNNPRGQVFDVETAPGKHGGHHRPARWDHVGVIDSDQISELTDQERRDLIAQLRRPLEGTSVNVRSIARARRVRMVLMTASAVGMVPWIFYLASTLPGTYRANNWDAAWVGFDVMLLVLMVLTLALGWKRRLAVVPVSFALGVLFLCDAWFDMLTAKSSDLTQSAIGLVFELPLAIMLVTGSIRMLRLSAQRLWIITPGQHVWDIVMPLPTHRISRRLQHEEDPTK